MQKIRLGKTGLMVSRVGMGGIPIQRPPMEEAVQIINRALDLGVNFIDTANGYGDSEERIGRGIEGRRDEVILSTKGGTRKREIVLDHIDTSLKRLKTDYIDLWQFHNIVSVEEIEQILGLGGGMEGALEALDEGKIRHVGFSSHNLDVSKKAILTGRFETVQFPLNFIAREAADELVSLAKEYDVGFIAMKPFAGGNVRDADLAIKYLLQFDNVLPDPGIMKVEEVEEIVGIVNGSWDLSQEDWRRMDEIQAELGSRFCRQCMYCMPCPHGVEIWLLMYMRNLHRLWPLEEFLSGWMAEAAESGRNCIQCGECEPKCPYHLPIREMIVENMEFYDNVVRENQEHQGE